MISYSLSGIDARGYISQFNGDININTLLTISTPNKLIIINIEVLNLLRFIQADIKNLPN